MPKQLVFIEDLVDHLPGAAYYQGTFGRCHIIELLAGDAGPASFLADAVHHLGVGRKKLPAGLLRGVGQVGMGVNAHLDLVLMTGFSGCFPVEVHQGNKAVGRAVDNSQRQGQAQGWMASFIKTPSRPMRN